MQEKDLIHSLRRLELTEHEARIYLALTELGPSNAGPVIERVALHRQFVYSSLNALEERGLVTYVVRNGRRVFQAEHPRRLIEIQRRRELLAESLIPDLLALATPSEDRLSVQTFRGVKEFRNNLITTLEEAARSSDKILRIMGGGSASQFYDTIGDFYETYHRTGQRLGVRKRLLAPTQLADRFREIFAREEGSKLRITMLTSATFLRISEELVTMEVYGSDPMIIQIWNRAIAQAHREHFELLWKKAEPVVATG